MRSSTFFFAGLVAVAHAQIDASIISQIPACATGPLVSGISGSGCQITDSACICGNQKLIADLQTAVKAQCSEADLASKCSSCLTPGRRTVLTNFATEALAVTSQICPQAAAAPAAGAASSASEAATSAAAAASSVSSVAASAAITTDTPSPITTAPSMGTGSAMINYTATTGDYTPSTPTVTPSTGAAAQSFALGSVVLGLSALGMLFAGL
jgi:hypothetical protein